MQTNKRSSCEGDCCTLGNLTSEKCKCANVKVECDKDCGCDPAKCSNRQMSLKQSLRLELDLEEKVSWGMDICTQVNFLTIMPRNIPLLVQSVFVEKKLIYAIQQQNE